MRERDVFMVPTLSAPALYLGDTAAGAPALARRHLAPTLARVPRAVEEDELTVRAGLEPLPGSVADRLDNDREQIADRCRLACRDVADRAPARVDADGHARRLELRVEPLNVEIVLDRPPEACSQRRQSLELTLARAAQARKPPLPGRCVTSKARKVVAILSRPRQVLPRVQEAADVFKSPRRPPSCGILELVYHCVGIAGKQVPQTSRLAWVRERGRTYNAAGATSQVGRAAS